MSDWEKQHILDAFQFELGKVEREYIRIELLRDAPLNDTRLSDDGVTVDAVVVTLASPAENGLDEFAAAFAQAISEHKHFNRRLDTVPA